MKSNKIIAVLVFVFISVSLFAHPPKKVELSYDKKEKTLKVTAVHKVSDVKKHYLNVLTITIDGKEVKKIEYDSQSSIEKHVVNIKLPDVKSGSEIKVKINCNKMGSKSAKLKIE